uniref:eosinophil peroxidase-like n=1 Tax=Styela clava TaxID=7725 RepID=UPI00193A03BA|nr:eosinophil peroxidase-like [Styela clava]
MEIKCNCALMTIVIGFALKLVNGQEDSDRLLSAFRVQDDSVFRKEIDLGISDNDGYRTHGDSETRAELMTCQKAAEFWNETELSSICDGRSSFMKRYSSIDGSCNNLRNLFWGKNQRPFNRNLEPDYCDNKQMPRCSATGFPLPNARRVSTSMQLEDVDPSKHHSAMLMQWGQYISHDFSFTPMATDQQGQKLECNCGMSLLQSCYNIRVSVADIELGRTTGCIPLSRSAGTVPNGCTKNVYREQVNQITSYIDASTVYGSTQTLLETLSNEHQSTMEVSNSPMEYLLPEYDKVSTTFSNKFKCPGPESHGKCFAAGDFRVNETPTLTLIHLLWVREHNRIAERLREINPRWSKRRIFWETRQIIIAQHQHITYSEYMKEILGDEMALSIYDGESLSQYNPEVDPTISNAFATAAFRFGHSQVTDSFVQPQQASSSTEEMSDDSLNVAFFNPSSLYNNSIGPNGLSTCLLSTPGNEIDGEFTNALRNRMFANGSGPGLDLLALNIQRGRDHGIPGYNKWRQWCGFSTISMMADLNVVFNEKQSNMLRTLYRSVEDIDLYVGGLLEKAVQGSTVGPTFACILKNQFVKLKQGDRFWFDNQPPNAVFNQEQVRELRKTTLAKVICNNMPQLTNIQPSAMRLPNVLTNTPVPCKLLPNVDLNMWRDSSNTGDQQVIIQKPDVHRKTMSSILGWGGLFLLNYQPTITLYADSGYTKPLKPGAHKRIGEMVFVEVGYDERRENYLKETVPTLAGIEVTDCTAYSESNSKYRQQSVQLILNGCPNQNIGLPITTMKSLSNFRFRFRYQNFSLRGSKVDISCTIGLCFKSNGKCSSKVC